jgi:hypothetical protein
VLFESIGTIESPPTNTFGRLRLAVTLAGRPVTATAAARDRN